MYLSAPLYLSVISEGKNVLGKAKENLSLKTAPVYSNNGREKMKLQALNSVICC
jgi:hypothetical protein